MKQLTALTTIAVITVAWIGFSFYFADDPDEPTPDPTPNTTVEPDPDPEPDPPVAVDEPDDDEFGPAEAAVRETDALTIEGELSHPMAHPSTDEIYAQITLEATEDEPDVRAPLNVALVVDRSGSMRGDPMAQARKASRTFVDALERQDRVSLIAFDHRIDTEVESIAVDSESRPILHNAIDRLDARGATNISGGLKAGYEEVARHSDPEMVERIVLMTDGIPNRGITSNEGLEAKTAGIRKNGVSTTALGFGPDYEAELLAAMAVEGAGNFRHVTDASDLEKAFADEIDDLQSTVASGVTVDLQPRSGVEIEEVFGYSRESLADGERITVGDLSTDETRRVTVKLDVDRTTSEAGKLSDLLGVEIDFVDRIADDTVAEKFDLDTRITHRHADVDEHNDGYILTRVEELRTLQSLEEIREEFRAGNRREAQERIDRERQRLERTREQYGTSADSAGIGGADEVLDRTSDTVRSASPDSSAARNAEAEEDAAVLQLSR